jgi:hypothetical protein
MRPFDDLARELGELVEAKNKAYGNSFHYTSSILSVLYPAGVSPSQYSDMLLLVRIIDKIFRVAAKKDAFGESPYQDIAGYALLGWQQDT